jgi:lipoprotein
MKKLLTLLLLVVFVACNKDTDEQKDALATRNGVSADAIFSSQKEIELHKSLVESFSQKEQSFAQEIQALRSRNALTEEVAREKLMPLVNESVHLLNSYGMSNEEIAQDFGSLNDPRIALAGPLITTLEKEKDKGGDIDESKFWDCALETMGFVVKNEERHEIFDEVRGFVSRMSKWFKWFGFGRFGTYLNVGSYIAEFTVCMLDKEYQKQMVSSPYGTINEDNPYSFINKPLILRENLVTFNLKDNPNQKVYLLKKEINYNEVDHSFEIKDSGIYHLFKYVDKYMYVSLNLANQMNIKLTPGKGYILHINGYYSYWEIHGNQIDKNSLSEEDIVGNLFDPTFKNNYTPKPYTPPADDGRLILEPYGDGFKVIGKTYDNPASYDPRKDEKLIKATSSEEESKEEIILKK